MDQADTTEHVSACWRSETTGGSTGSVYTQLFRQRAACQTNWTTLLRHLFSGCAEVSLLATSSAALPRYLDCDHQWRNMIRVSRDPSASCISSVQYRDVKCFTEYEPPHRFSINVGKENRHRASVKNCSVFKLRSR